MLPYGGSLRVGLPHPPKANAWQFFVLHECILAGLEDSLLRVVAAALVLPLERGLEERQSTAAELLGGHRRRGVLLNVDTVACLECRRPKGRASHVVGGFRRRGGAGCRGAASRGESSVVGAAVCEEGGLNSGRPAKQLFCYGKLQHCVVRWPARFPLQDFSHTSFILQTDELRGGLLLKVEALYESFEVCYNSS